jgi:hypothetical protein
MVVTERFHGRPMTESDGYPPPVPDPSENQLLSSADTVLPEDRRRRESSYHPYAAPGDEFSVIALACLVLAIGWTVVWVAPFHKPSGLVGWAFPGTLTVLFIEALVAGHLKKDRPRGRILASVAFWWTLASSLSLVVHAWWTVRGFG